MKKTCQRVFQALRIDVNREFEVLYEFMEKLPGVLKPGGRVAILTFQRCDPSVCLGVCPERQSQINEDALGDKSIKDDP